MNIQVEQALGTVLKNWRAMTVADMDEAEGSADQFEASFYSFIDTVREWATAELKPFPQTIEQFLALPPILSIMDKLPAPLHINFETEAELIIDNIIRVDDEKYD
ncbi:hypothetical protein [Paenibacillus luteus]|uniref:hypothetical protein n=1 Tax=Paenibacillus luteus TaxID=2545753 RepID=UPI0011437511|nr:hypothetical protein [Paenibacillus luteus]